ncbi:MAG TPA: TRAP transporter small permease subunit [Steroidobacteraceae bacterium]|nr:TRAP transporter small permease subunit [Steroidobacteraceae bacterium]
MDTVNPAGSGRRGPLFYIGAGGLLTMMLVETAAVIGRHIGVPVTGALEIVTAAIVPAACAAMLIATLRGAHAAVHMLTDRMPHSLQRWVFRMGSVLAGLCFAALAAGSAWLAAENWNSYEQTEVLHIPFRPLRVAVTLAAAALALVFFHRAIRAEKTE